MRANPDGYTLALVSTSYSTNPSLCKTVEAIEPAGGPPEEFLNAIRSDVAKWAKVVKAAGITLGN